MLLKRYRELRSLLGGLQEATAALNMHSKDKAGSTKGSPRLHHKKDKKKKKDKGGKNGDKTKSDKYDGVSSPSRTLDDQDFKTGKNSIAPTDMLSPVAEVTSPKVPNLEMGNVATAHLTQDARK